MLESLSQHLLEELRNCTEDSFLGDTPESEREEMREIQDFISALVDQIMQKKQMLLRKDATELSNWIQKVGANRKPLLEDSHALDEVTRALGRATRDRLDARYSEEMLEQVPLFVDRTLKLATLDAKHPVSNQTNRYIHEVARAYIYGLPLASVVMSRAAMEQALRDRLGYQGTDERVSFDELVIRAQTWGLLPRDKKDAAGPAIRDVNRRCNEVLHQKPVSDDEAFGLLSAARSVIEELYSVDVVL